jgi:nitrogen fixation protein NifU and related proteins
MPIYSDKVMDHFMNPRNVGEIQNADGVGEVGNPVCGDMMTFYIKVDQDRIADIKFQTFGCGAAIAVSSMVSEMARGKTLAEASKITNRMVAEALEGLPKQKLHCSNLGADALQKAIRDYQAKTGQERPAPKEEGKECFCPFCDIDNPKESEICTGCGTDIKEIEEHTHH